MCYPQPEILVLILSSFLQICLSLTLLCSLRNRQQDTGSLGCCGFAAGLLVSVGSLLSPPAAASRLSVVTPVGQGPCLLQAWLRILA